MGKANTSVNQWLRDNHRFASLYNGYVFGGRQIIRPEELEDLDRGTGATQGKGELSTEEFLSRFRQEDFIYPILTLVFYYDEKKWDGATDLYGMFPPGTEGKDGETKEVLRKYVPNYRMNLIDAGHMEEAELQRLSEDLQQVLGMLKYRGRRKERVNMCQALEEWYQDALKEGEVKGREAGVALAKKVFRLSAEGRTETEIAVEAGISPDEVQKILK